MAYRIPRCIKFSQNPKESPYFPPLRNPEGAWLSLDLKWKPDCGKIASGYGKIPHKTIGNPLFLAPLFFSPRRHFPNPLFLPEQIWYNAQLITFFLSSSSMWTSFRWKVVPPNCVHYLFNAHIILIPELCWRLEGSKRTRGLGAKKPGKEARVWSKDGNRRPLRCGTRFEVSWSHSGDVPRILNSWHFPSEMALWTLPKGK